MAHTDDVDEPVMVRSIQQRLEGMTLNIPDKVLLLAVSKGQPWQSIRAAYSISASGRLLRHFGESFVQELVEKASRLATECPDILWHFIGHLQTNKVKQLLAGVGPKLWCIETVDSKRLAACINKHLAQPLRVMIQVNVSGESTKHGCKSPEELQELVRFVKEECPLLVLIGLMTVEGKQGGECLGDNFSVMRGLRDGLAEPSWALSMGMSGDWQEAISGGSTEVRLGTCLFGNRKVD